MAASFFINAMQVDFASVLAMEHTGMAKMFKSLEDTGLKGFLEASSSMFEGAVTELFANVKVIAGKIVSFVANRKMVITKDVFTEAFELPTEGLVGFLDILTETVVEMRFLGTDVPLRTLNKKKEMRMEYRLLHDIISKALCELKEIVKQHRALRSIAGLPLLDPEASIAGDAADVDHPQITWSKARQLLITGSTPTKPEKPNILALEFSTQAEQEQTTAQQPAAADFTQAGPQQIIVSQTQADNDKELVYIKDSISSLRLNVERIKDDVFMAKHTTLQFKRHIDGLENSFVRHFGDSQQKIVDEIALVKLQLAEMFDCLKELRDAKKGEWDEQ
ncbi:hypothetical protein F511_39913 [Dorcoceras hygrometricum]|uniref:Uncharacterized protein n=1 Tax=Dorcoceras hygrometricum TaxID=472368 RepID=A0A2Z7CFR1_9LAMI|nr:hypothetical protein F511_39913 [Dorcoceras hygrometricum]